MTMIVETGSGVSGANSYCGLSFSRNYLAARNNVTAWDAATVAVREAALIEATSYIDLTFGHRFFGVREYQSMTFYAKGFVSLETQPTAADTITVGDQTYTFVSSLTGADEILIGGDISATLLNIADAINATASALSSTVGASTVANTDATAALSDAGTSVVLTATASGLDGNSIATTTSNSTAIKIDTSVLTGGRPNGVQPLEFPRDYLYDRSGVVVDGIPEKLMQATVEYASRAITASLLPDPTYDTSGRIITQKMEKVGPIEEETTFLAGALTITRKYPFADRMLREYMASGGGVMR